MSTEAAGRFRVGRKLGRTIYRDDELIGVMDRAGDAAMVVAALNGPGAEIQRLRECLEWLNNGGGLGHDVHRRIDQVLAPADIHDCSCDIHTVVRGICRNCGGRVMG